MGVLGSAYITKEEFKSYQKIDRDEKDDLIESAIIAASSDIESYCGRQFNRADTLSSRIYTSRFYAWVDVDDFWTDEGLEVEYADSGDDVLYSNVATLYHLSPVNGIQNGQLGWPYRKISVRGSSWRFPEYESSIRVTAKWGWVAVPAPVRQSCLIMAAERFKLKDAPFGVAGVSDFGVMRVRQNPMVATMLRPYVRNYLKVGT